MVAGDFKTVVLPLSNKLYRFALHILRNEENAKDVIQDIFLKLWQKRDELRHIKSVEAYATRMTRNRCLDLIRAQKTVGIEERNAEYVELSDNETDRKVELSESAHMVKRLIQMLPETQRTVMYLRDIEQYTNEEVAEMTQLHVNAVRVNLSRARKRVRDEMLKQMNYGNSNDKEKIRSLF